MALSLESLKGDEKYPLLLLYMDNDDKSKDFLREKKQFPGISAVVTRWPESFTSHWASLLLIGFLFILLSLFVMLCPMYVLNQPIYLTPKNQNINQNTTIFLVHNSINWTSKELSNLISILDSYPTYNINILLLNQCENLTNFKPFKHFKIDSNITIDVTNEELLQFKRRVKIIEKIINHYPNVKTIRRSCASFFNHTQVEKKWVYLSPAVLNFAARTEELWNNGGITFDLDGDLIFNISQKSRVVKKALSQLLPTTTKKNFTDFSSLNLNIMKAFEIHIVAFNSSKVKFLHADEEVFITLNGSIMMAQTPCHAFIEQILTNVAIDGNVTTILEKSLTDFCESKVENKFCNVLSTKKI